MEPLLGQIQAFGFNFAPRGWAKCEGQILQISQAQELFSLLGTMYGGDGLTTFGIPDLRGKVMNIDLDAGSTSDSQMQSTAVTVCIATKGVYPSRS